MSRDYRDTKFDGWKPSALDLFEQWLTVSIAATKHRARQAVAKARKAGTPVDPETRAEATFYVSESRWLDGWVDAQYQEWRAMAAECHIRQKYSPLPK